MKRTKLHNQEIKKSMQNIDERYQHLLELESRRVLLNTQIAEGIKELGPLIINLSSLVSDLMQEESSNKENKNAFSTSNFKAM